jgi:gluconolactonase
MKAEVWDARPCALGEGPVATGPNHEMVLWVDITGQRILWRDIATEKSGEWFIGEDTSFVIPRLGGGMVIGTANGPVIFYEDGRQEKLPTRWDADGFEDPMPMRWNDAKVSPHGELWLGSMAYGGAHKVGGLYQLRKDGKLLVRVLSDIQISNGLDWTNDEKTFYYIDTPTSGVDAFDYHDGVISNRRRVWTANAALDEWPDGMTLDSEDGLWVAMWGGSCVRRIDAHGQVTEVIQLPNKYITSCAFTGSDLKTLVITTARGDNGSLDDHNQAGMTYAVRPGVTGRASVSFG